VEKASAAGLDHEQPGEILLRRAISRRRSSREKSRQAELDDHVHRILRSHVRHWPVIDDPRTEAAWLTCWAGMEIARKIEEVKCGAFEERSRRSFRWTPRRFTAIAVIGAACGRRHDFRRRLGAGRSSGRKCDYAPPGQGYTHWQEHIWFPTSPLKVDSGQALQEQAVQFMTPGTDPARRPPLWPNHRGCCDHLRVRSGRAKAMDLRQPVVT
jgi:beta-glucosidase